MRLLSGDSYVKVTSDALFCFSLHGYDDHALERANHEEEIERKQLVMHLDRAVMGVGGVRLLS